MSRALTLVKKLRLFTNLSSYVLCIPHTNFPYQKHGEKSKYVVTPRELNILCGESNEINVKKLFLSFTAEKKIVCF